MGNALGKVCVANESEIPVVVVVSQAGPLYWTALQPGQSWTQKTGKVWFTLEVYPFTGNNKPTKLGAAVSVLVPTGAALAAVVTGKLLFALFQHCCLQTDVAAKASARSLRLRSISYEVLDKPFTLHLRAGGLGAGFASAAIFGGKAMHSALTRSCNHAMKKGHYADGHQVRVRGGPKKSKPCKEWKPLRFE